MCLTTGDMKEEEGWAKVMPFVRDLTRRKIGQIWAHHTGHDESRGYGTKTREWQLDVVVHMTALQRPDTDISFTLEFTKARERTPSNRADFQPIDVALVDEKWVYERGSSRAAGTGRAGKGEKAILAAITEVLDGKSERIVPRAGMPVVTAVKVLDVREEFERRYVAGEKDKKTSADAKRMAFKRALKDLPKKFSTGTVGDVEWIWKTTP
jgi:hypothetical protein